MWDLFFNPIINGVSGIKIVLTLFISGELRVYSQQAKKKTVKEN